MTEPVKKEKEKFAPLTEFALDERLRVKYPSPEYAYFSAVRNGTGFVRHTVRTIDGMAIGLWPSRGLELIGFELKSSRGDWLREKKDPAKAHDMAKYCDRWYLVAGRDDIVLAGELPIKWGLIVPHQKGLKIVTEAPVLESSAWDRLFLASLVRSISENYIHRSEIQEALKKAADDEKGRRQYELDRLKEKVEEFEKASGIKISDAWDAGYIGEAVKFLRDHGLDFHIAGLKSLRDNAKRVYESVEYALSKEGISGKPEPGSEAGSKEGSATDRP
jgi:hypothetical protein